MTDPNDEGLFMTGNLKINSEQKTWSDKELHLVPINHEHAFVVPKMYTIDVDKIQDLDDVKSILRARQIQVTDQYPGFAGVAHLLSDE